MDPNGTKPEETGIPPMMRRMMEKMCGTSEFDPAAMCRQMMGVAGRMPEGGCAMPECCKQVPARAREATPDAHDV